MGRHTTFSGVVEDCLRLDIADILPARTEPLKAAAKTIAWSLDPTGERIASLNASISLDGSATLIAELTLKFSNGSGAYRFGAHLVATRTKFFGTRIWFACPIDRDGRECGNRCRVLYLPPGQIAFGCRECHNLTYQSCRDSHRRRRLREQLVERFGIEGLDLR